MEDDEAAWEGWDVESNSSHDSGSWHDVESDGEKEFDVSDSDNESPNRTDKGKEKVTGRQEDVEMKDEAPRVSTLATTKACPTHF